MPDFVFFFFFFQAEDGIRDLTVTGVQTCALPIYPAQRAARRGAELRQADPLVRCAVGGREELPGGGPGVDPPRRARCRRAGADRPLPRPTRRATPPGGARMTETIAGRRRLGRGLEALLGPTREEAEREGSLVELAIADIRPNPYQPRRDVDPAALEELTASIRKAGLLQPVVVRQAPGNNGGFELIAGERRLRACQALGWEKIPAPKREVDDRTVLTLALVENLQRDDLSPVGERRGDERLLAEFSLTQQDVADAVGRDRSTVANALRLLKLPAAVLALLHEGRLSVGHARALLALDDARVATSLAKEAVDLGLSVRDVEDRVRGGRAQIGRASCRERV